MSMEQSYGHIVQKPKYDGIPMRRDQQGVIPRFFTQPVETDQIDQETGLKVFRQVEYLELLIPGDKGSAPVRRVNDELRRMYADAYRAFKERGAKADMIGDGIPLKLWGGIKSEVALGLEQINIFTVQQLAGLSDARCSQPGHIGLRDLRERARSFLEQAGQAAPLAALQKQIEDMTKANELRDTQLKDALAMAADYKARFEAQSGGAPSEQMPELSTPRARANKEK